MGKKKKRLGVVPQPPWFVVWGFRRVLVDHGPFSIAASPSKEGAKRLEREMQSVGWYTAIHLDKTQPKKLELKNAEGRIIYKVRPSAGSWNPQL